MIGEFLVTGGETGITVNEFFGLIVEDGGLFGGGFLAEAGLTDAGGGGGELRFGVGLLDLSDLEVGLGVGEEGRRAWASAESWSPCLRSSMALRAVSMASVPWRFSEWAKAASVSA